MTQRIDKETGLVEFEYNNFHTSHGTESWQYKIMWKVDTKSYQYDLLSKTPILLEGLPYLRFEFSVPKILFGHNLESCSVSDAFTACSFVRESFNKEFDIDIPTMSEWYCYRIDTCANFILENEDQVRSYIRYLQKFDYPRRIKNLYEDTGIYFASRHNTLKIYCKGAEFKKHDMRRFISEIQQRQLYHEAQKILRIEVEHKNSLKSIYEGLVARGYLYKTFQGYMKLVDLFENNNFEVIPEMERIVKKFIVGTETKPMKSLDVFHLFSDALGSRKAKTYYAIYMLLITQGQKETKRQITKSLYYNALKQFRLLGISVIASDIQKMDIELNHGFPADFHLSMDEANKFYQLPLAA